MPITGFDFDILGVTVGRYGPVKSLVHLELDPGVTALYGLNGAGKSTILQMASWALAGIAPPASDRHRTREIADVHVQVRAQLREVDDDEKYVLSSDLLGIALQTEIVRRRQQLAATSLSSQRDRWRTAWAAEDYPARSVGARLREVAWLDLLQFRLERDDDDGNELPPLSEDDPEYVGLAAALRETVDAGFLTLRALGTAERPGWNVLLPVTSHGPAGRQVLAEEVALEKRIHTWRIRQKEAATDPHPLGPSASPRRVVTPWNSIYLGWSHDPRVPPDWVPAPTAKIAELWVREDFALVTAIADQDPSHLDETTLDRLHDPINPAFRGADAHGNMELEEYFTVVLDAVQADANAGLQAILQDAPEVRFELGRPAGWLVGDRPGWLYRERSTVIGRDLWLPLESLSKARRRWAMFAVGLAAAMPRDLSEYIEQYDTDHPLVFFCDEPEEGLHRLAERRLAKGLPELAQRTGACVLAATHSPDLLNAPGVRPVLITRTVEEGVEARSVSLSVVDGAATELSTHDLGLSIGDLAALARLSVVVEGIHDEAVFASLIRDELDTATAQLFPIHGGTRLRSLADARLIIDGTDAQVLVVLDELEGSQVDPLWADIRASASTGDANKLADRVEALREMKGDSFLFLHQFASRAQHLGRLDRVHVHGLSLPDVICYLPPDLILLRDESWEGLIADWRKQAAPHEPKNIKAWLKNRRLLPESPEDINVRVIEAAAAARRFGRPVHSDLVRLGTKVLELGLPRVGEVSEG